MTKLKYLTTFLILILTVISLVLGSFYLYSQKTLASLANEEPCTNELLIPSNQYKSKMADIIQLNKYNQICKSQVTDKLMIFSGMPNKLEKVSEAVINIQSKIYEITKYNLTPLIVLEPTFENTNISFNQLVSNEYNLIWDKYFSELNKLNPDLQAEWIFLPESNTPIWDQSNFNVSDFGLIVNQFGNNLKKYFPNNKLDLLFDSKSYNWNDKKWQKPSTQNFNQYLIKINKKLIDKLWLQGFPYSARKSELLPNSKKISETQISEYLNIEILKQSADYLGIKNIGINTGTFSQKYLSAKDKITLTNSDREKLQNNLVKTIQTLKNSNYQISVNLFLQNKLKTPEETNWSYLDTLESQELFRQFVYKLNLDMVQVSIFDNF
jgi:hypothetical protein